MSVALEHVTKRFGSFVALDGVSLEIPDGSVHALLGANGSGKSTLVRIVTGVHPVDGGDVVIDGTPVAGAWTPAAATAAGVRVVHQEAPLADNLSIAESVGLFSHFPRRFGVIDWRGLRRTTQGLLDELRIDRAAKDLTSSLTGAERTMLAVELAVLTAGDSLRLLLLDEATAALPEAEALPFLQHVRTIADRGVPVLMVTHRLGELSFADQYTVLDAGQVALSGEAKDAERPRLIAVMRGNTPGSAAGGSELRGDLEGLWSPERAQRPAPEGEVLVAEGLRGGVVRDARLRVAAGEIVGVIGVRGEGMEDLPRLIAGATPVEAGTVTVAGRRLPRRFGAREALDAGVGFLPADRLHEGGIASLPLRENIVLPDVRSFWHRRGIERVAVARVIRLLDVRPADERAMFGRMSGGNQQKAILGRLLRLRLPVLVLSDPTYGVDPAAREIMFDGIRAARARGAAVILTSTEPEQLTGLCDRVIVMRDGRIAEELSGDGLAAADLMAKVL